MTETNILRQHLIDAKKGSADVLLPLLPKLDDGTHSIVLTNNQAVRSDTPLCVECVNRVIRFLFYVYRRSLKSAQLPAAFQRRSDCWYGRYCRTQFNPQNPNHAASRNHVCEPTRGQPPANNNADSRFAYF